MTLKLTKKTKTKMLAHFSTFKNKNNFVEKRLNPIIFIYSRNGNSMSFAWE